MRLGNRHRRRSLQKVFHDGARDSLKRWNNEIIGKYHEWVQSITIDQKVFLCPVGHVTLLVSTIHFADPEPLTVLVLGHLRALLPVPIVMEPHPDLIRVRLAQLICGSLDFPLEVVVVGVHPLGENVEHMPGHNLD